MPPMKIETFNASALSFLSLKGVVFLSANCSTTISFFWYIRHNFGKAWTPSSSSSVAAYSFGHFLCRNHDLNQLKTWLTCNLLYTSRILFWYYNCIFLFFFSTHLFVWFCHLCTVCDFWGRTFTYKCENNITRVLQELRMKIFLNPMWRKTFYLRSTCFKLTYAFNVWDFFVALVLDRCNIDIIIKTTWQLVLCKIKLMILATRQKRSWRTKCHLSGL